jgi:hypothetical protein
MLLKTWRFFAVMLTALLMSMGFTHLWQLAPRMEAGGPFWFETLRLYRELGPDGPGPWLEVAACVSVALLVPLSRRRGRAFWPTLLAAVLLASSLASWWLLVRPVDLELLSWTATALPVDWVRWRDQWEYAHAARALLSAGALAALLWALLLETPRTALRGMRAVRSAGAEPRPMRRGVHAAPVALSPPRR